MEQSITAQRDGKLSSFLRREMGLSGGLVNRLKWQNAFFVNGQPQHTNFLVCAGDVITVRMDEEAPEYPAEHGPLTILYEDEWILAVDKPSGMLIHPSRAKNEGTLANLVAGYYQDSGQHCAFHPLTRLDRDTFGVVLLAKYTHIHAMLQQLHPQKTYHALTFGVPENACGEITAPIARCELPSLLRRIDPAGKPCHTVYRLLETNGVVSRLELFPITGRTHQLRLHCAYMGCPILGDPQYGTQESRLFSEKAGFFTQQLCAREISFVHPVTGEQKKICSLYDFPQELPSADGG